MLSGVQSHRKILFLLQVLFFSDVYANSDENSASDSNSWYGFGIPLATIALILLVFACWKLSSHYCAPPEAADEVWLPHGEIHDLKTWRDMHINLETGECNVSENIAEIFSFLSADAIQITPEELSRVVPYEDVPEYIEKYDIDKNGTISVEELKNIFPTEEEAHQALSKLLEEECDSFHFDLPRSSGEYDFGSQEDLLAIYGESLQEIC